MSPRLPSLQLTCFGPPTALLDGRPPPREVLWQKHLGILIYLALSPGHRRTRSHLVGLFWPEITEQRARKALNESVLRLRKRLGTARLRTDGEALVLDPDGLEVDAVRFASLAPHSPGQAVELLRGDFLEGFSVKEAPAFEEWARVEGGRYRALGAAALVAGGERWLSDSRFAEAGDAGRRALSLAPYSEPAIRLVMRAAALAGDPGSAVSAFKDFCARLHEELGQRPTSGLAALTERISRYPGRVAPGPAEPEPPLVGREVVYREAFEVVAQGLRGGPRTLVVTGASGMGRSRLVAECLRRAALDGALAVLARPLETDHDAPWSALRLLLRGGLTDAPGLAAARPEALSALAGVLPELGDRFPPRPVADVADMATALASVLGAISEERPIAIALDDAHWADGNSVAALAAATRRLGPGRVALIISAAQGVGDPPRELLHLESDVGRALPGIAVRLDALTEGDVRSLVRALVQGSREEEDVDRLTRRLAFETGGSPFFAVTLLKALARATRPHEDPATWPPPHGTFDASLPFSIPSPVKVAIALRVGELSADEQAILGAASVTGQALDLDVVSFLADRPRADVERALPAFERSALVAFDGQRYVFAALVAEVVRAECLLRGERRRLERRAVEALAGRTDLESRVLRAELLARTDPGAEAFEVALAVTRDALEVGAVRVARRAFAAAERVCRATDVDRARLEDLRGRV